MKKKWYKSFAEWTAFAVEQTFGLHKNHNSSALLAWIDYSAEPTPAQMGALDGIRMALDRCQYDWNEYELLAQFIGPLLATVSFYGERYSAFHQRTLVLPDNGQQTEGKVDGMVALGRSEPEVPFFFLHEYKKSQGYDADPEGQLLIAMVAAQRLNDDGLPLYGCYIVGSYWRFVLLDGKNYAVSQGYDATDAEELRIIWSVLQHTKRIVEERVEAILAAKS